MALRTITTIGASVVLMSLLVACGDDSSPFQDGDASTDTDTDTDTDVDTDTDSDTDTDTDPVNPCPEGQHAECYADDVWCLDASDTPIEMLDDCTGGEQCVVLNEEVAECQCVDEWSTACYGGDVWYYDSCGEMGAMAADCGDSEPCTELDGDLGTDCCEATPSASVCDGAGDVQEALSCLLNGPVPTDAILDYCNDNQTCATVTATSAACECENQWTGTECMECPPHWDAAADCGSCAGYWTGVDCDVCSGFGSDADHCQCPDGTFVPQPDSEHCWTCPLNNDAVDGVCPLAAGDDLTWAEANAACPSGFSLPSLEEYASLYTGCAWDMSNFQCDYCADSPVCNSMYGSLSTGRSWMSLECEWGNPAFFLEYGYYTDDLMANCFASTDTASGTVCVK